LKYIGPLDWADVQKTVTVHVFITQEQILRNALKHSIYTKPL